MMKTSTALQICIEFVITNNVGLLTRINDVCILLIATGKTYCWGPMHNWHLSGIFLVVKVF